MARSRLFIAARLQQKVVSAAVNLQERLARQDVTVKWVPPESLHLTLAFLGDIDDREQHALCKAIQSAVQEHGPITLHLGGLGAFPTTRRPKVLWLGVQHGAEELTNLQQDLEHELEATGLYRGEDRPYVPHLTLGRIKDEASSAALADVMADFADYDAGTSLLDALGLYASDVRGPSPTYTLLGRMPLGR